MRTLRPLAAGLTLATTLASAQPAPRREAAAPASAAPTAPGAKELVAKVQRYYDQTRDLKAHFDQTLESGMGGNPRRASGEVYLKKPGRMRWDYVKPEKKIMVADGQTLWVYEEEDQQAFKQELRGSTLPTQVSFLVGEGKLADEFEASVVKPEGLGQPGEVVLRLVPRAASAQYRDLIFVVDPQTGQVRETLIHDQQGGTNRLRFSMVEQNKGIEDARFKFTPPAGTKVVSPPR